MPLMVDQNSGINKNNIPLFTNNSKSELNGRKVKKEPSRPWKLVAIALAVLCAAGGVAKLFTSVEPAAIAIPEDKTFVPAVYKPNADSVIDRTNSTALMLLYNDATHPMLNLPRSPNSYMPDWVTEYMNNGIQLNKKGDAGCVVNVTELLPSALCEVFVDGMKERVLRDPHAQRAIKDPLVFREKGQPLSLNGKRWARLGINPQKKKNYQQALEYVKGKFISDPDFFNQDSKKIVAFIKQVHALLLDKLPVQHWSIEPGKYRKGDLIINKNEAYSDDHPKALRAVGGTEEEIELLKNSMDRAYTHVGALNLTPEEQVVWNKIVHFPSQVEEIPGKMLDLAKKWKWAGRNKDQIHPIALAAWVHQSIGEIHPFGDGNGRLARLLMNAILMKGGYDPVVFPNDEEYTQAICADQENPGSFVLYLKDQVIPWNEKWMKHGR